MLAQQRAKRLSGYGIGFAVPGFKDQTPLWPLEKMWRTASVRVRRSPITAMPVEMNDVVITGLLPQLLA